MKSRPKSGAWRESRRRRSFRQLNSELSMAPCPLGRAAHERFGSALLGPAHQVLHGHAQRRVLRLNFELLQVDQIAQVTLQRRLGGELQSGRELDAVRREYHLQQAAAEVRPIDAFTRAGEEQLF